MSLEMKHFTLTLKHDQGKCKLRVTATSEKTARLMVRAAERCPDGAIIAVKEIPALS